MAVPAPGDGGHPGHAPGLVRHAGPASGRTAGRTGPSRSRRPACRDREGRPGATPVRLPARPRMPARGRSALRRPGAGCAGSWPRAPQPPGPAGPTAAQVVGHRRRREPCPDSVRCGAAKSRIGASRKPDDPNLPPGAARRGRNTRNSGRPGHPRMSLIISPRKLLRWQSRGHDRRTLYA